MTAFKIIVLTIFIMLSICFVIDITFIAVSADKAVRKKLPYEKKLGLEMVMLLVWSFCLSCLILL